MMSKWLRFAPVLLVLAVMAYATFGAAGDIGGKDARRLVAEGALLVDVRTGTEFAAGHIEGAINIPVQQLDRRLDELGAKDRPLVLYCRSGQRSARAARMLGAAGFTAVHDLGPMTRW
jgi:rhodanese-related sulfurtransferase